MGDDERLGGDIEEEESGTEAGEAGGGLAGAASSKIVKILLSFIFSDSKCFSEVIVRNSVSVR